MVDEEYQQVATTDVPDKNTTTAINKKPKKSKKHHHRALFGVGLVLTGTVLFPLANVFIKLGSFLNSIEHLFVFLVTKLILLVLVCFSRGINPLGPRPNRLMLCARGLLGCLGSILAYKGIAFLPISNFAVLSHSTIIFTALIAWLVLDEKLDLAHLVAIALTIVGVVCISKPTFIFGTSSSTPTTNTTTQPEEPGESSSWNHNLIGVTCILTSGVFFGLVNVVMKKLSASGHLDMVVVAVYDAYFGVPASLALVFFLLKLDPFETNRDVDVELDYFLSHFAYSLVSALLGVVGQVAGTLAFRYLDANMIPILRAFDVVVAFALQVAVLGVGFDSLSVTGSVAITSGILILLGFNRLEKKLMKKHIDLKKRTFFKILFFKF